MEHRWSTRKLASGSVVVDCPRNGTVRADIGNVSLGGMFVQTETLLPVNAVVILGFSLPQANQFDFFRLQAMVVHQVAGGAGLMFDNLEADVVRAFRSALYEDVAPAPALESWESTRAA